VPTTLLTRWETALEDVSLWRFAPTATHGDLTGDQVLAVFTDDADASTGRIRAVTGWEDAKVADPADDFAALVADARPEAVETVLEAYSHTRVERPDPNLLVRARLVAELGLLGSMMVALARKDAGAVEVLTTQLRRLDDAVHASEEPDDYRRTSLAPVGVRPRPSRPPALEVEEDDEDLPGVEEEPDAEAGEAAPDAGAGATDTPDGVNATGEAGADDAADDGAAEEAAPPDADQSAVDQSAVEQADVDQSAVEQADADQSAVEQADADQPAVDEADQVTTEVDLRSGERPAARE